MNGAVAFVGAGLGVINVGAGLGVLIVDGAGLAEIFVDNVVNVNFGVDADRIHMANDDVLESIRDADTVPSRGQESARF